MVTLTDLCFSYKKGKKVFDNLSLSLEGGNIYGLLGKNGAGKTTLLKIICGLLFADSGKAHVLGYACRRRSPEFLSDLFFIPEEFHVPPVTAAAYWRYYHPFYPHFDTALFESSLSAFSLKLSDRLSTLSYGNKKKFLIAFGLACGCKLLILDEPTNGLDIPTKSQFRKLVAGALTEERAFVISTHQVRDMENLIDPVIILDNGRIVFQQTLQETSAKLSVARVNALPENTPVLFSEKTLAGYTMVTPNTTGEDSGIDLELLFNAVIANGSAMEKIFSTGGQ